MSQDDLVIDVKDLVVHYGKGRKRVEAVRGVSFEVRRGECVGFIGANGAGKSTTMKTLMGFIFPSAGTIRLFGADAGTVESRQRIGYLPEVSLYYPFMKARELLELYGGLHGLSASELKLRIPAVLEKVGLKDKAGILLKNFSKGMQQRLGIAQSIIADPELLIFDELSSGLDPVGRHDLREVLLEIKRQGRTIFFSSHELSEVESLCDRVVMIHRGRVVTSAAVSDLMKPLNLFEITFKRGHRAALPRDIADLNPESVGAFMRVKINGAEAYAKAVAGLNASGIAIESTESKSHSLEEYFIELVRKQEAENLP